MNWDRSAGSRVLTRGIVWVFASFALACGSPDSSPPQDPEPALPWVPPPLRQGPARTEKPIAPSASGTSAPADTHVADLDVAQWAERAGQLPRSVTLERIELPGLTGDLAQRKAVQNVRVVLRFDGAALYRRSEQPAGDGLPRRLVLDLDRAALSPNVPALLPVSAGGLDRIRAFVLDEERVRVSFDLRTDTQHKSFFLTDPFRVVADFRVPPSGGRDRRPQRVVVIDPGHGGQQPGAKGPGGLKESQVALALARRARQVLARTRPDVRVLMTRDDDRQVSLEERVAIANALQADLFVSVHLNASDAPDEKGGVATFVLDTTDDQAALRLAARENGTDAEGVSRLQLILASLYRKDQVERSLQLAERVHAATLSGGRRVLPALHDRGVKRALFYVLVGAEMPAVLLEASFISRKEEAEALATDTYRQALAEGIAEGIGAYLDAR